MATFTPMRLAMTAWGRGGEARVAGGGREEAGGEEEGRGREEEKDDDKERRQTGRWAMVLTKSHCRHQALPR